ncbi:MAG TPA: hypothetical protein VJG64_01440 [Candidatus Paceibacterota bacterium]
MRTSSKITGGAIVILLAVAAVVWAAALREDRGGLLTISFLNAGKSDVIFIDSPSGRSVLIDGGSDAGILRELATVMPWWDRSIDVVIAGHPDAAHTTGLVDVLRRFHVSHAFHSNTRGSDPASLALARTLADVEKKGMIIGTLQRGRVVDLGPSTGSGQERAHAYIEILFPDRDLSGAPASVGCLEMRLIYGATSFMFSCGNAAIENYLVRLDADALHSDVLSINNGASATTSPLFAGFVGAQYIAQSGMTFVSDGTTVSLK